MAVEVIIGPPGTGKTTTISRIAGDHHRQGGKPLICSLTRAAAAEAAGRQSGIPKSQIGTLHSFAFHALGRPAIVTNGHIGEWNAEHKGYRLSPNGVGDKVDDLSVDRSSGQSPGDSELELVGLLRSRMVPRKQWPSHTLRFADRWDQWKRDNDLLDFVDLIDEARVSTAFAPGNPDMLILDEAQDSSRLELELMRRWTLGAGNLLLVGDPRQAIYTWRGAHPAMFNSDKIDPELRTVLSQSYRVPIAVHSMAERWATGLSDWFAIDYSPTDELGSVGHCPNTYAAITPTCRLMRLIEDRLADGLSVMVCASCSYMLGPLTARLRAAALPFSNPWRSAHGGWNPLALRRGVSLVDRLAALLRPLDMDRTADPRWTWGELDRWSEPLRADVWRRGAKAIIDEMPGEEMAVVDVIQPSPQLGEQPLADRLEDMIDAGDGQALLQWWHDGLQPAKRKLKTLDYVLRVIENRGISAVTDEPKLYVGTIHSFKGAEADVVIVFPDLSNSGGKQWGVGPSDGRDEIIRLGYVALTRARREVVICATAGRNAMPLGRYLAA